MCRIFGARAWVSWSGPITLTSNIARQSAGSAVSTGSAPIAPPALLTSTSQRSTVPAKALTASASVTSSTWYQARPPASTISLQTAFSRSSRRASSTTS